MVAANGLREDREYMQVEHSVKGFEMAGVD
jgi:hypothetical protein